MKIREYNEKYVLEIVKKAYEKGDVKFDIIPDKCALIVIDMQNEFVKPEWTPYWVPESTRQVPKIKKLIEHSRKKKWGENLSDLSL